MTKKFKPFTLKIGSQEQLNALYHRLNASTERLNPYIADHDITSTDLICYELKMHLTEEVVKRKLKIKGLG